MAYRTYGSYYPKCSSEFRNVVRVAELYGGGSDSSSEARKYSKAKREILKSDLHVDVQTRKFNPFLDCSTFFPEPTQQKTEGWRIDSKNEFVRLSFNGEERDVSFLKKALSNVVEISKVIFCRRVPYVDGVNDDFFLFGVEISGSLSASSTMGISSVKRGFERRILILEKKIQSIDTDIIRLISQRKIEEKKEEPGEGFLIRLTECINQKKNMKVPLGEEYMQLEKYIKTNTFRLEAKILVYNDKHAMLFEWGDTFQVYCGYTPNDGSVGPTMAVNQQVKSGSPEYCIVKRRRMKSFRRGSRIVERMKQETFLVYKARKKINITSLILEEKNQMYLVPRATIENGLTRVSVEEQIVMRGNKFVMFGSLILYKGELIVDESWSRIYVPDAVLKSIPLTSKFFLRCCKTQALDNDNLVKYLLAERRNEMWLPSKSSIFPTEHNNWMLYLLLCHDSSTNEFASISADVFTYSILPFLHVNHVFWILPSDLRRQERTFYFRDQLAHYGEDEVEIDEVISTVAESYTGEILSMIYDHFDQTPADFYFLDRCRLISIVRAYDSIFENESSEWMSEMLSFLRLFFWRATLSDNPNHCGANSCKGCGPIDRDAPPWATMRYSEWEKLIVFSFSVSNCCHRKLKDCSRSPKFSGLFYQYLDLLCDIVAFWETICGNTRSFRLFGKMLIGLGGLKGATEFFWGTMMRFYSRFVQRRRLDSDINENFFQRWYKLKFTRLFRNWIVHGREAQLAPDPWILLKLILHSSEDVINQLMLHPVYRYKTLFIALSSLDELPLSERHISEQIIADFPIITTNRTEDLSPVEVVVMLLLRRYAASRNNRRRTKFRMYDVINECFQWDSLEFGSKMIQAIIDSQKRLEGILQLDTKCFRKFSCFIGCFSDVNDPQLRKWAAKVIDLVLATSSGDLHQTFSPVVPPKIVLNSKFMVKMITQVREMLKQATIFRGKRRLHLSRSDVIFIINVLKLIRDGQYLNPPVFLREKDARELCSLELFLDLLREYMLFLKNISKLYHTFSTKEIRIMDVIFSETPRFIENTSLLLDNPAIFHEYAQTVLDIWCSIRLDRVFFHESSSRLCSIIKKLVQWLWLYFPVYSSTEVRNGHFHFTLSFDDFNKKPISIPGQPTFQGNSGKSPDRSSKKAKIPSHPSNPIKVAWYPLYFMNGFPRLDYLRYAAVDVILALIDTSKKKRGFHRIKNYAIKLLLSEIPRNLGSTSSCRSFIPLFFKVLLIVRLTRSVQRRKLLVLIEKSYENVFGNLVHSCTYLDSSHEECEKCSMFSLASHDIFALERDNHFLFESTLVFINAVIRRALKQKGIVSYVIFHRFIGFRSFSWVLTFTDLLSSRFSTSKIISSSFSPVTKFKFQEVVDLMLRCVKVNPNEKYEVVLWKFLREAVANVSNLMNKFADTYIHLISFKDYVTVSDILKFQCRPIMEIIRARVDVLLSSTHPTEDEDRSVSDSLTKAFMVLLAMIVRIQSFVHPVREFKCRVKKLIDDFTDFRFITVCGSSNSYNKEKVSAIEEKDFNEMCNFDYLLDLYSKKRMKFFHSTRQDKRDFNRMLKYFNRVAYACWSLSYRFADKFFEFWISIARLTVDPNCGFIDSEKNVAYSLSNIEEVLWYQLTNILLHNGVALKGHDSYERILKMVVQMFSKATVGQDCITRCKNDKEDRMLKLVTFILSSKNFAGTLLSSELWELVRENFDCQLILRSHKHHKEIMKVVTCKHLESNFIDITGELLVRMKALKKRKGDKDYDDFSFSSLPPPTLQSQPFVLSNEEETTPPFVFDEAGKSTFVFHDTQASNSGGESLSLPWEKLEEVDLAQKLEELGEFYTITSGKEGKKKKDNKPKFMLLGEHFVDADPAENSSKGLDFGDLASSFDSMIAPSKEEGDPIVDTKGQDTTSEMKENESKLDENFSFGSMEFNFDSSQTSKSTNMDLDYLSMNFDSIDESGAFGGVAEEVSGSEDIEEESKHPEAKGE